MENPSLGADFEFEFDVSKWEVGKARPTKQLAALLKDYGGFPESVLVRQEMAILWGVLVEKMVTQQLGVAVVGSPGVGKSVIVVLFSLFLAMVREENVLLLRAVKRVGKDKTAYAVICFRGPNEIVVYPDLYTIADAVDVCKAFRNDCLLVIDGLNQDDLSGTALKNFDLLSTSAQYSKKNDDLHDVCLLPAWQEADLELYASQLIDPVSSRETFELHYEYSGGNLRNFIRASKDLAGLRVIISSDVVDAPRETIDAMFSEYSASRGTGLDRLQRTYVIDRNNAAHYSDKTRWRKVVDSFVARKGLSLKIALDSIKSSMQLAESSGVAAWRGWVFEEYVHKMASLRIGVIRMYPYAGGADRVSSGEVMRVALNEIENFECSGNNFASCSKNLARNSAPGLYWCPDYAQYPALDAVLFLPSTKTVLYIQTTVSKIHTFNPKLVKKTHDSLVTSVDFLRKTKECKATEECKATMEWTYAYVVIVPSQDGIDTFSNADVNAGVEIDELEGKLYVGYIDEEGGIPQLSAIK